MFKPAVRQAQIGIRSYSSQVNKAQSAISSILQKGSAAAKTGIYYSKVAGELAKYVWIKEGLSPPTAAEFQKVFTTDLKSFYACALNSAKQPAKLLEQAKGYSSNDYIRFGALGVQLLGLFALGEIIGRRHIYGYKDHKHAH